MIISSSAIVLSKLKFRDNDLIVKLLVRELGVTSFIVRGGSKKNKTNYFQQLSLLEIEFDFNSKKSLHYFKDFENKFSLKTIHTDYKKMGVVIFLSEFLSKILVHQEKDFELFSFIENSIKYYDDTKFNFRTIHTDYKKMGVIIFLSEILSKILVHQEKDFELFTFIEDSIKYYDDTKFNSSFHLAFLIKLSKFLGFFPETENNHYKFFDCNMVVIQILWIQSILFLTKN